MTKSLPDQLGDALVSALAAPVAEIDLDLGDAVRNGLVKTAHGLAEHLTGGDRRAAQNVAESLMVVIWRGRNAPWAWWGSELGQAIARALEGSTYGRAEVSRAEAASMLGIGRSRVDQLARAGRLEKTGRGEITRASILRLATDERRLSGRKAKGL